MTDTDDTPQLTGPELLAQSLRYTEQAEDAEFGTFEEQRAAQFAMLRGQQAQSALLLALLDNMHDYAPYEVETWREVLPLPPLKECKGKEARRPECAERHTEDCDYADPIPEPPHKLLPVGTRVLVSETATKYPDGRIIYDKQPKVAKIVGYDMGRTKYELNDEKFGGGYYNFSTWAFTDNRVQPHPEQDGAVTEPTGPRIYVQDVRGRQGYVVDTGKVDDEGGVRLLVQWFRPGARPVWKPVEALNIITADDVERCPNGQTRDECASGENQCERCLADEDAEAEAIEGSMNV